MVAFDHLKISHNNDCPVIEAHKIRSLYSLGGPDIFSFQQDKLGALQTHQWPQWSFFLVQSVDLGKHLDFIPT